MVESCQDGLPITVHPDLGPAWDYHWTLSWYTVQDPRAPSRRCRWLIMPYVKHSSDVKNWCLVYPLKYFLKFKTAANDEQTNNLHEFQRKLTTLAKELSESDKILNVIHQLSSV